MRIAAKRYALFSFDEAGEPVIPPKGYTRHGLGYLLSPSDPDEEEDPDGQEDPGSERDRWERRLWEGIVRERLGLTRDLPDWLDRPAVARLTISSPWHLAAFRRLN